MMLNCDNASCHKSGDHRLDIKTMEVICCECGKVINNISAIMKNTLKQLGQIIRSDTKKAFQMACKSCNANREVILDASTNTVCKVCGAEIKVHAAMKQAMIELAKLNKDE
jgi:hypothetical protein